MAILKFDLARHGLVHAQTAHVPYANANANSRMPACSLPSISNLLDLADAGSPTTESHPSPKQPQLPFQSETRPGSSYFGTQNMPAGSGGCGGDRTSMPPTPPMMADHLFSDTGSSPKSVGHFSAFPVPADSGSSSSNSHSNSNGGSPPSYETTPTPLDDPHELRSTIPRAAAGPPPALPQSAYQSVHAFAATTAPYATAPMPAYFQPVPVSASEIGLGMCFQRPLPQEPDEEDPQFPISIIRQQMEMRPWDFQQHHHHQVPASALAPVPQSQDRYVCPTCGKAFSRPSSLKIHTHSHTGEKPFTCPRPGCGKAFSVRSNMKRHERGCHSYGGHYRGV